MQSLSAVSLRPALVVSAAAVIVAVGIEHFASLVVLVAFSALIAVLSRRLQLALLRRRLPSWLALTVTLGVIIVLLVVLFGSAVLAMGVVVAHLSADEAKIASGVQDVVHGLEGIVGVASGTLPTLDPAAMLSSAKDLLASITGTITTLAMSVLIVTYLLIDAGRLRGRMLGATSPESVARYDALAGDLVTYIRVRAVLGGAAAICDVVLLLVIGVPNALLWGVMSFLFSFVPNLGFIIALIPPTVIALVELGVWPAVAVVVGYVAINLLFDYVLQPRMMQTDLDLSPVVVITTIVIWTALIGPMGALLAVPLTISLRAVLAPFPGARWFLALLGPVPDALGAEPRPQAPAAAGTEPTIGA